MAAGSDKPFASAREKNDGTFALLESDCQLPNEGVGSGSAGVPKAAGTLNQTEKIFAILRIRQELGR
jgi:hypothetical protein